MAFRGIGDAATQVIKDQNQQGMEAARLSENARQFDAGSAQRRAQLGESARQFDAGMKQDNAKLAENTRQFDAASGQRQSNMDEQTRQFEAQRADTAAQQTRQYSVEDFKMGLMAEAQSADLAGKDVDTQARLAQLNQYVAVASDEERRRKNREKLAKGAFGSMAVSAIMNGGVIPASALEIANKELGDKENQIVGGGVDPDSGVAFFNVRNAKGETKQLKMPAENQFAVLQDVYGDGVANTFANHYKQNSAVASAIERARITATASAQGKEDARRDPLKVAEVFRKQADGKLKQAEAVRANDQAAADALVQSAIADNEQATKLTASAIPEDMRPKAAAAPAKIESTALDDATRAANKIPPDYSAKKLPPGYVTPNNKVMKDGGFMATFTDITGRTVTKYIDGSITPPLINGGQ